MSTMIENHPMPGKPLRMQSATRTDIQQTVAFLQAHDPRLGKLKVCQLNKPEGRLLAGLARTHRRDVEVKQTLGEIKIHLGTF